MHLLPHDLKLLNRVYKHLVGISYLNTVKKKNGVYKCFGHIFYSEHHLLFCSRSLFHDNVLQIFMSLIFFL